MPDAATTAHLVFLPQGREPCMFVWGGAAPAFAAAGSSHRTELVDERLELRRVDGRAVPLIAALPRLAALGAAEQARLPASWIVWSQASKLALELAARQRFVPRVVADSGPGEARFAAALGVSADAARAAELASAMPLAAHAVPASGDAEPRRRKAAAVMAPEAVLGAFLDAAIDALVRAASERTRGRGRLRRERDEAWESRFVRALCGADAAFTASGLPERTVPDEIAAWAEPALHAEATGSRPCFRLELPEDSQARGAVFPLRFFLQDVADPSLMVPAREVFAGSNARLQRIGTGFRHAEERLLRALATSARMFAPIERALQQARPELVALDAREAWTFLAEAAPAFAEAGLGVILPAELTRAGQRRLRLRMRSDGRSGTRTAGVVATSGLALGDVLEFRWELALGDDAISARDLDALAALKAPLVRFRGRWVAVDPGELHEARAMLGQRGGELSIGEALAHALGGAAPRAGTHLPVEMVADGAFAAALERLRQGVAADAAVAPEEFTGTLRPYQQRGLSWLVQLDALGLGACLADDMGLGKTIELIAFLLHRQARKHGDERPVLLVCPTSVIGNWLRELERFGPTLPVQPHYGSERARTLDDLATLPAGTVVVTSYGLLRRDAELLLGMDWSVVALDEAQNIKNAAAGASHVARSLRAGFRVALTGTPVENRLSELWSVSEFLNPRLLGPLATFKREVATPIERYGCEATAGRLQRIVRPFILRRLKSDPAILPDLPPKHEMKVFCTLTREQASLYEAAVRESMRAIEAADGISRRGRVLALLTALKQICNHPAHYLRESGPLAGRSGKLQRLCEMLDEVVAAGDKALVFTQFREMGDRLVAELARTIGCEVPFLHGGVPRTARDALVRRFQEAGGPPLFVLSLKAGGTGLNLTAASHVFHFDRWWNPAVEDQATDRAHRIGQHRTVQVHKFLCAGTVEEKVDELLEHKRDLAQRIIGSGEQWLTELGDRELRELFALSPDAVVADAGMADGDPVAGTVAKRTRARRGVANEAGA